MTECERIVKSGRLDESFFRPEYRCGFYVNEYVKKIWAVELDLYLEFERICKKFGLKYYVFWGSLLGAIRHNGFIPWDDDFDLAMPRNDYERLISLSDEFENPYFLQTPLTDPNSGFSYIKLRNSNTSAVIKRFKYCKMNQGLFIDIVPIDNINEATVDNDYNTIRQLAYENSTYMRLDNPELDFKDKERVKNWKGFSNIETYEKIQKIASKYEGTDSSKVAVIACDIYGLKRQIFNKEDFENTIWKKYENIEVPVPNGFDNVLKVSYGNYLEFPPIEKRVTIRINNYASFNPDVPYTDIVKLS